MKKRTAFHLVLLLCLVASALLPACIFSPEDKLPHEEPPPTPPPDDPPPDPPPPPSGPLETSSVAEALSMQTVAYMVLRGDYGPELRALLADEVSVLVNKMAGAGMMSIFVDDQCVGVRLLESEQKHVLYDDSYLVANILSGAYGSMARRNLHSFARSFETGKVIP